MNKKIGIITGASAYAGLHMYEKLLNKFIQMGIREDKDFPQVLLHNYPFKSINVSGVTNKVDAIEEVIMAMNPLEKCDKIIIACNSLNILDDSRLINLPKLLINHINNNRKNEKFLILCSESSKHTHLFGESENLIYLDKSLLLKTKNIIEEKITNKSIDEIIYFELINQEAKKLNATTIVVGCTELSMLNWNNYKYNEKILDCVDLAIQQTLNWYQSEVIYESL